MCKSTPEEAKAEPSQLLEHWHSDGKGAGTLMRGRIQKMIESVLFKVSTQRRIYLWPKTRNEKLSVQKKCFSQGHVKLEKGASCESWSTVVCLACAITCFAFSFLNDIMLPVSSESNRDLLILPILPICSRGTLVSFANLFHFISI